MIDQARERLSENARGRGDAGFIVTSFREDELCMHAITYSLLSTLRSLAGESNFIDEAPGLGLKRARRVLRIPGRIVISARRATLVIKDTALALWRQVIGRIHELHPSPATK